MRRLFKILKYALLIILIILLGTVGYFYYDFNYYSLEDEYDVKDENLMYFNNSYDEARAVFRQKAEELTSKYPESELFNIKIDSKIDTNLTTEIYYIPGGAQRGLKEWKHFFNFLKIRGLRFYDV